MIERNHDPYKLFGLLMVKNINKIMFSITFIFVYYEFTQPFIDNTFPKLCKRSAPPLMAVMPYSSAIKDI